jgi:hypothetical protein
MLNLGFNATYNRKPKLHIELQQQKYKVHGFLYLACWIVYRNKMSVYNNYTRPQNIM